MSCARDPTVMPLQHFYAALCLLKFDEVAALFSLLDTASAIAGNRKALAAQIKDLLMVVMSMKIELNLWVAL